VSGLSMIEFALVLPVLLVLLMGIADFGRLILFENILINMSREGANLASRSTLLPQFIIDALNHTASPLDMETQGMVYITRVMGVDGGGGTLVWRIEEQYRAGSGDTGLLSQLTWHCSSWTSAKCNLPAALADKLVSLPLPIALGAEVHVVEALYHYKLISKFVIQSVPDLYSATLL
jgi:hypothetical protein